VKDTGLDNAAETAKKALFYDAFRNQIHYDRKSVSQIKLKLTSKYYA
jgi:hypothetical protein